jgi:hypothetical protein
LREAVILKKKNNQINMILIFVFVLLSLDRVNGEFCSNGKSEAHIYPEAAIQGIY